MRRLIGWQPVLLVLILTLFGCTTYVTVDTEQLTTFEETVRSKHELIDELRVKMSAGGMKFTYTISKEMSDQEIQQIFYETKALILDPEFQQTAIEEQFLEKYSKDDRDYPQIYIDFYQDGDDNAFCTFDSSYYRTIYVSNAEVRKLLDGYQTWSYWDYKNEPVRMP